jgi:hypothetical protein
MKLLAAAVIATVLAPCLLGQDRASEAEARRTIEAFFQAFNKQDAAGMRNTLQFPHIRIASGRTTIVATPEQCKGDLAEVLKEGWHHSTLDRVEFVHSAPDKVHAAIAFSRYRADGTRYATYRSLWIITRVEGRWGIQCRSSFAP